MFEDKALADKAVEAVEQTIHGDMKEGANAQHIEGRTEVSRELA